MTNKTLSTHAAAAKMIRAELKRHGIPGRVTSESYAGGSSVSVHLADPLPATVAAVEAFANQFQYGHFDGMTDCYDFSNRRDDLPQVKFVMVYADYSDEIQAAAAAYAKELGVEFWLVLSGRFEGFWTSRKPRVRAA